MSLPWPSRATFAISVFEMFALACSRALFFSLLTHEMYLLWLCDLCLPSWEGLPVAQQQGGRDGPYWSSLQSPSCLFCSPVDLTMSLLCVPLCLLLMGEHTKKQILYGSALGVESQKALTEREEGPRIKQAQTQVI